MSGRLLSARRDFYRREKQMLNDTWPTAIDEHGLAYFVPPTAELTADDDADLSNVVDSDEEIATMQAHDAMATGTWRFQISLRDERNFLLTK
jgi:hypothetical protein